MSKNKSCTCSSCTSCQNAKEALKESAVHNREHANQKAKRIVLKPNVLLLLLDKVDKFSWQGPFRVTKKISDVDYEIQVRNKLKVFHINML